MTSIRYEVTADELKYYSMMCSTLGIQQSSLVITRDDYNKIMSRYMAIGNKANTNLNQENSSIEKIVVSENNESNVEYDIKFNDPISTNELIKYKENLDILIQKRQKEIMSKIQEEYCIIDKLKEELIKLGFEVEEIQKEDEDDDIVLKADMYRAERRRKYECMHMNCKNPLICKKCNTCLEHDKEFKKWSSGLSTAKRQGNEKLYYNKAGITSGCEIKKVEVKIDKNFGSKVKSNIENMLKES